MSGHFVFRQNGETFDTRDYDVTVVPADIDSAPARSYTAYPRGGGNGDILVNTGRFDNVQRSYYIIVSHDFVSTYEAICDALLPFSGYGKLMDSWATDEFFNAYLDGDLKPILTRNEEMGKVLVTFSRKPQRWLLSGENWTILLQTMITNSTPFAVQPTFRIQIKPSLTDETINQIAGLLFPEINGVTPELWDSDFVRSLLRNNRGNDLIFDYAAGRAYIDGNPEYDDGLNSRMRLYRSSDLEWVYQYPAIEPGRNTVYTRHSSWGNIAYVRWGWYTI